MRNHLIVFARAPQLGRVKRRLARDIGEAAALRFYRRSLETALRRLARDRRWRTWLAVTPDSAAREARLWRVAAGAHLMPQGGGDLGARMARAMRKLPPGPAVIIGSDVPGVSASHIARAFALLGRHDAVFGPAADGGYWLVGLRRRPRIPELFAGVRWSVVHALADTLANLQGANSGKEGPRGGAPAWRPVLGRRVAFLERLEDVDEGRSYRRWLARGRAKPRVPNGCRIEETENQSCTVG